MNWGSRNECHCPSTVWEGLSFCFRVYMKKITRYVVKFLAQKLAIVFQHKLLFNIVKDIFNWIEGLERSVTVQVHSEKVRFSVLGCVWKMYSMRCQISRSKTRYIVFQHKLLFNLVKDLFKKFEGLGRSVAVLVVFKSERFSDLGCVRKKYSIRCQILRSKTRYIVFQHKLLFNLVKDVMKWIEGLGTSVTVRMQSEGERIFDPGCIQKKVLDTLSNFALKNSIYSVST